MLKGGLLTLIVCSTTTAALVFMFWREMWIGAAGYQTRTGFRWRTVVVLRNRSLGKESGIYSTIKAEVVEAWTMLTSNTHTAYIWVLLLLLLLIWLSLRVFV